MNPKLSNNKLTDDAVAGLPLQLGRADLLEEIMSTPVLDDRPVRTERPRRRPTWAMPAAAAAVVAALAVGSAWWATGSGPVDRGGSTGFASQPAAGEGAGSVVLDAPGWTVSSVHSDEDGGELTYVRGGDAFEVSWYPADSYDSYVEDRRHISNPPADGDPVEVLGLPGLLWAYPNATEGAPSPIERGGDHTVIRDVEGGRWFELRGKGMDKAAFLALLDRLRVVDQAEFEAAMPDSFVDGTERGARIEEMLAGIREYVDPIFPGSSDRSGVSSDQVDPYQLGAEVSGAVACAWLDEFAAAQQAGADDRAQRAADVLATSHDWPVLHQMTGGGDYREVLWGYADEVAAGRVPEGYARGLGCEG